MTLRVALVMMKVELLMILLWLAKTLMMVVGQLLMAYTVTLMECVISVWLPCEMSSLMATVMIVQVMAFCWLMLS